MSAAQLPTQQGKISFERAGDATLLIHLSGPWHLNRDLPPADVVIPELQKRPARKRASFGTSWLTGCRLRRHRLLAVIRFARRSGQRIGSMT